jgi:8-oxo-dGTP pyrophosphatase MutT (NUDIX family)
MKSRYYYNSNKAPSPNMPRSIGVVGIIYDGDDILFEERRSDEDKWSFIGGKVEDNESVQQALLREIKEETGQDVSVYEFFGIFSEPGRIIEYLNGGVKQVVTIAFKVKLLDNNVKCSNESKSIRFRDINEMSEDKFVETHIPILRAVKDNKKMHID